MLNIVVARQGEELRWIDALPEHCTVTVCSDDASQGVPLDVTRPIDVLRLPGQHGVGELYLAWLKRPVRGAAEAFTVFCPGDPLAACPDFLARLADFPRWAEVQPLTPERFDLRSWAPLGGFDKALYRTLQRYRQTHQLPEAQHPGAHFLAACGQPALAQAVGTHDLGVRDRGLVFAVRHTRLAAWQATHADALPGLCDWLRQDATHGRIWDQFWLHQFGLPLVRLPAVAPWQTEDAAALQADDEALADDFSLSRALAAIDETLARLAPPPLSALQAARARARTHGPAASARTGPAEPIDHAALSALSDRAAHAFRLGDLQNAIACARRVLAQAPDHQASQFTLAMALAAQGERTAALEQFEQLLHPATEIPGAAPVADHTAQRSPTQ